MVRSYFRRTDLQIEEDEVATDPDNRGAIRIYTSDRDSAGDDEPPLWLKKKFQAHMAAVRELSPHVFASLEVIDEWIGMTVYIRKEKRQAKPESAFRLEGAVVAAMPGAIVDHPRVRHCQNDHSRNFDGTVVACTDLQSPIGKRRAILGWSLIGTTLEGWRLKVEWGVHTLERPAKFKKLGASMIVRALNQILEQLSDPLDIFGWEITAKKDGDWIRNMGGRNKETFYTFSVTEKGADKLRCPYNGDELFFENRYSGEILTAKVGETLPEVVKPVTIVL